MRLWQRDGIETLVDGGHLVLEELSTYRLQLQDPGSAKVYFGERRLEREADGRFLLEVGRWSGSLRLQVQREGQVERLFDVQVLPQSSKLDADAWSRMLEDLDAWLPGITVGMEGGRHGRIVSGDKAIPGLAAGLLDAVPALCAALRAILDAPRESVRTVLRDIPIRSVRKADPSTFGWIARDARARGSLGGGTDEATVLVREGEPSLDNAVNRYTAWLARRVLERLDALAAWLAAASTEDSDQEAWRVDRLRAAGESRASLSRQLRSSFLFRLRPETPGISALLTVQDDPRYGRFHRLCRPFLSPTFRPPDEEQGGSAPIRPSFGLYELWTLLALRRLLEDQLPGARWKEVGLQRLFLGSGSGACFEAQTPAGKLGIHFNPVFPSYPFRGASPRFSVSKERRPDLVITWQPSTGAARWVCMDAKYRVSQRALGEAFESAHIYRDSLYLLDHGGRCAAAWLLVPAMVEGTEAWFDPAFLDAYGSGAFRLRPGASPPIELASRLFETLGTPSTASDTGCIAS